MKINIKLKAPLCAGYQLDSLLQLVLWGAILIYLNFHSIKYIGVVLQINVVRLTNYEKTTQLRSLYLNDY